MRDQIMEMSTEGVVIGAVNGTYELSIDHYEVYIYDPTGVLARLLLQLDFVNLEFRGRLDTRRLDGGWSEGDWVIFWRA